MNKAVLDVTRLRAENLESAFGIGESLPRLSWNIRTDINNWRQTAYEIEAKDGSGGVFGLSGKITSDCSLYAKWPFEPLRSRTVLSVRVRVWGEDGSASKWSLPLEIEAGLLRETDWKANFITPDFKTGNSGCRLAPYLRREFSAGDQIRSARLYVTALGLYQAYVNGIEAGDQLFTPGWTAYDRRLPYQTLEVTNLIKKGTNTLGVILAEGWYSGRLGPDGGRKNIWGDSLALLSQLEILYEDGTRECLVSDKNWKSSAGGIVSSGIYDGEVYDARLEPEGWKLADFNDDSWSGVRTLEYDFCKIVSPAGPPVRVIDTVKAVSVCDSPSGKTIVDFGQNLVGRLKINIRGGRPGDVLHLRHAEVMENNELGTRPLRQAKAADSYTFRSSDQVVWEPLFTFHGFRYVEIEGWPGKVNPADITALVIHSDMPRTGWFESSNPEINRLHENVRWSMKGNFLHVPTDCPQRDERLGWTGDIQVFSPAASFLYDSLGFLQSWLADLAVEQEKAGGAVPPVVPNALGDNFGAAAWGDAATVVPWVLYKRFGDLKVLQDQMESMCAWVDYIAETAGEDFLWNTGFQFGDWLDPCAPPDKPWQAKTGREIVATAYFAHSAGILSEAAALLNQSELSHRYSALAGNAAKAFRREYVTASGRMMSDSETAYALALVFGLFENAEQRNHAGARLAELVRDCGYHISTGFVGTPLICDALSLTSHHREAYRLLTTTDCPSWLYPVVMGATTVWERWDSMLPDGTINPGEMTSFNHYALGAVADWMHRVIGGISAAEPGFRKIRIAPRPGGGITSCKTSFLSPYGKIECVWSIDGGTFNLDIEIPANTRALVVLPGEQPQVEVGSGSWCWSVSYQDPDLRGPFTVDDEVGEILSDSHAAAMVLGILEEFQAPGFLRAILFNERKVPLRQILSMLSDAESAVQKMNELFSALKNL